MAEKNTVPNLEAKASDRNPIFTPRQWLERFRQFTKREHKIDITLLVKGEDITEAGWTAEKEAKIQEDFIWGVGPEALYQTTREYKTEPDRIKIKDLIRLYTEHFLPKRNTYHNREDFFWKQSEDETHEEFWRRLVEIEKECNFGTISAEELLISKYMTAITDKKLRDKLMKEKTLEMKKTIEMIKQNTYEKKQEKYNTRSINHNKRKTDDQRRTNTKSGEIRNQPKTRITGDRPCRFCNAPNWNPTHKCPALESNCNNCGKKGHYVRACKQRTKNNRALSKLTEEEETEPNESMSESDESIYHIEEIKNIVEQQKHYTAIIKINGTPKEFIIDTGSPVTIMPLDEQIIKKTEIQKLTNRYQDVNKNEVKFRGKIPVNIE